MFDYSRIWVAELGWQGPPESSDGLKLSAEEIGQGWGEVAVTSSNEWMGCYFIRPGFMECALDLFFCQGSEAQEKELLLNAVNSVKSAAFHSQLWAWAPQGRMSIFMALGFEKSPKAPQNFVSRLEVLGLKGEWVILSL
jgi:hypothetical protein